MSPRFHSDSPRGAPLKGGPCPECGDLMRDHQLTYAEVFYLLARQVDRCAKDCLRAERAK